MTFMGHGVFLSNKKCFCFNWIFLVKNEMMINEKIKIKQQNVEQNFELSKLINKSKKLKN